MILFTPGIATHNVASHDNECRDLDNSAPTTSGSIGSSSASFNSAESGNKRPSADGGGRCKDKKSKGADITHKVTNTTIYNISYYLQ